MKMGFRVEVPRVQVYVILIDHVSMLTYRVVRWTFNACSMHFCHRSK